MKKNAFSLIELIFVIVIISILSGIGFYMSYTNYTQQDAQYTLLKLKEARYRALGYETGNDNCYEAGWVQLTKNALSSNETPRYEIKSTLSLVKVSTHETPSLHNILGDTICFDSRGRPHDGNSTTLNTLIVNNPIITFSEGTKESNITIFRETGYAIIPCSN